MPTFEIVARDGAGRVGRYATRHGTVTTPTLLPVINPNRPLIAPKAMRAMGCEMVITNSYIIKRTEQLREVALAKGVHEVIGWDGPVMTDSGTFQMYVYGKVEVGPEEIVAFQRDIGVDVGTILDIFSTPDRTHAEAEADMMETLARARAASAIKGEMALAATVQGGVHPDLRQRCAEAYRGMDVDFHPVGGVVPLMEQQRYAELAEVIVGAKKGLHAGRPVHLFGAGHPLVFPLAALLGCDVFDSASYAKYAADGRMMFAEGTRRLEDLAELPCSCPVCASRTAEELRKDPARERLLAEHNLHVSFAELRRVRQAIREGSLWELAEQRCRAHPALLDGFRAALRHADWIETLEPISKPGAFFWTGRESALRPETRRARGRLLGRFRPVGPLLPVEARRPYSRNLGPRLAELGALAAEPVVLSPFGPVPVVLDEVYPFSQSAETAEWDPQTRGEVEALLGAVAGENDVEVLRDGEEAGPAPAARDWDLARVRAVCDYQFGPGAADALLSGEVTFRRSESVDRVRNVFCGGEHVLSLRATDGHFTLKAAGARRLHAALPAPRLRVVVEAETAPFNRSGKNVMAKFVQAVDADLRPKDECLVVTPQDELFAVAQLHLAPSEVGWFRTGIAAHVREGVP